MPERHAHSDFLQHFTPGLLDPAVPTPDIVTGHSGKTANKRFNVYRNNVTASLVNAVGQVYPLTRKALGEDRFRAAALTYVRTNPPTSKLLFEFGYGFDAHLQRHGFDENAPWIGDLARLERAWLDVYHAADAAPLAAEALGAIAPEALGDAVFEPHPAARLLRLDTAAVSAMTALRSDDDRRDFAGAPAETALVTRPALAVTVRALRGTDAIFFDALMAGRSLAEAAGTAQESGDFDLAAALGAVLESGAFTAVNAPNQ